MPNEHPDISEIARNIIGQLAGERLPPAFAKLYSQHTRLGSGQPGLGMWGENEALDRFNDALRLIDAGLVGQESGSDLWRDAMRRAGELLEWLAHPQLNPANVPVKLFAAAAYQLAGYPARASAILEETIGDEPTVMHSLLQADFPRLLNGIMQVWKTSELPTMPTVPEIHWTDPNELDRSLSLWVAQECFSALGVLCAYMRWGDETRLAKVFEKLDAVADVALHGVDPYSWMLAKLCSAVARVYVDSSLRIHIPELATETTPDGTTAFERYNRLCYLSRRALAWPSQVRGMEKLASGDSFALCTPTGSGKTMVAELGIIQSLFTELQSNADKDALAVEVPAPIALYLVPSRALAAEVESKLSRVLRRLDNRVIVTGLYGGTDWGPTDAWLTADDRTVLICTYEKGEALLRFLGPHFVHRVSLVVIDEAHKVQFDGKTESLVQAESRPLRLEVLGARLFAHMSRAGSRTIALSAVASGCETALASWVTQQNDAVPVTTYYRSTRQLIGRLECLPNRRFEIRYDLLDGASLRFLDTGEDITPFIPRPFAPHPTAPFLEDGGPELQLRPYLFWAAMNLAKPDENDEQHSVLISVMQKPSGYAAGLLRLLESEWSDEELPTFFRYPTDPEKIELWRKCLDSCRDYFGAESLEYKLLERGIVLHHGKLPSLTARLFTEAISERIVYLVIATSTLSEGVNLPFETVLIPTLRRSGTFVGKREFANLVGRAGRPGSGTEGRTLVLMRPAPLRTQRDSSANNIRAVRRAYSDLISGVEPQSCEERDVESPLAALIESLRSQWATLHPRGTSAEFSDWLENTAPLSIPEDEAAGSLHLVQTLDSLDSILLASIVEIERVANAELADDALEAELQRIWQRSYAHYANRQEADLGGHFIKRGKALTSQVYPDPSQRRRLYHTSLPPRFGMGLIELFPEIIRHFQTGGDYATWNSDLRFNYVHTAIEILSNSPKFKPKDPPPRRAGSWANVLRWWLNANEAEVTPAADKVAEWQDYVHSNFSYKASWGIGSIIGLALSESGERSEPLTLEDWPRTNLPWIAFWFKELLVWGTLEPVAAYLLAKGFCTTRNEAETVAVAYYESMSSESDANEILSPRVIRHWADQNHQRTSAARPGIPSRIATTPLRNLDGADQKQWHVLPVDKDDSIYWTDPAGFALAVSSKPTGWSDPYESECDFLFDAMSNHVNVSHYL